MTLNKASGGKNVISNIFSSVKDGLSKFSLIDKRRDQIDSGEKDIIFRGLSAGPGVSLTLVDADNSSATQEKVIEISTGAGGMISPQAINTFQRDNLIARTTGLIIWNTDTLQLEVFSLGLGWQPVSTAGTAGSAVAGSSFVTVSSNPGITNARILSDGKGTKVIDTGPNANIFLDVDASSITTSAVNITLTDELVYLETATGKTRKATAQVLPFATKINSVSGFNNVVNSTVSSSTLGPLIVSGDVLDVINIIIDVPFSPGTDITVGDGIIVDKYATILDIDPQIISKYSFLVNEKLSIDTQVFLTITGSPSVGSLRSSVKSYKV